MTRSLHGVALSYIIGVLMGTRETSDRALAGGAATEEAAPENAASNGDGRSALEKELADYRTIQRAVIDSTSDMIWAVDPVRFGLLFFNRGLADYFGERGIELKIGDRPEDMFFPPGLIETWHSIYERALARGPYVMEYNVLTGTHVLELNVNVLRRGDEVFGVSVFGKDITERKRAEQAIRESEARWRTIFGAYAAAIALVRTDSGEIVDVNRAWEEMTGFPREEALGRTPVMLGLWPAEQQESLQAARMSERLSEVEVQIRRKDGQRRDVSITSAFIDIAGEKLFVAISQDVTDRKRAREELRELSERLFHQDRVVRAGEITSSLAHELNQPLAGILSNAQAIRRYLDAANPDLVEIAEAIDDIIADDKRAAEVIHRLRGFLKKDVSKRETVDVSRLAAEVAKLAKHDLEIANVVLVMAPEEPPATVVADAVQVQQVILNLINNAEQALTQGWKGERRIVVTTSTNAAEGVTVVVRDTGPGFADGVLERIFDPFYSTKPSGMGLGLAISRSIVEAHEGKIWGANAPEGGAIVTFILPPAAADE